LPNISLNNRQNNGMHVYNRTVVFVNKNVSSWIVSVVHRTP